LKLSVSNDNQDFNPIDEIQLQTQQSNEVIVRKFEFDLHRVKTRFVKVHIKSIGICPDWHKGAGGKAWLFIDEITIK